MRGCVLKTLCLLLLLVPSSAAFAVGPGPMVVGEEVFEVFETAHPYAAAPFDGPRLLRRFEISYPGAAYIAPHFSRFELADGDFLVVRSPDGSRAQRYERSGKGALGRTEGFWGIHIPGDTAILELHGRGLSSAYGFAVDRFARGFRAEEVGGPRVPESLCGTDDSDEAKCYLGSGEYEEARAVARLLIQGSSGCTGWLLGDEGHLITNNHCIGNQTAASNTDYEFMAEGDSCAQSCEFWWGCPGVVEATSATFVQTDFSLDFTLVKLPTNVSGTYGFMQLREAGPVMGEQIYIPQHAAGWGKRLAIDSTHALNPTGKGEVDSLSEPSCQGGGPPEVGYYLDTQGGSSGSPVLANSDLCVVALHHCRGNVACTQTGGDPNRGVASDDIISDLGANLPRNALCGQAGPVKCFDFDDFCDGLEVSVSGGRLDGFWRNTDCAGTDVDIEGAIRGGAIASPCGGTDNAIIDCSSAGAESCSVGGGDWYFTLDALDGTMDLGSGVPFGGACWIDELAYTVTDGACAFAPDRGGSSLFSSVDR